MRRYDRHGLLAIEPSALVALSALSSAEPEKVDRSNLVRGEAVLVRVQGPLDHHRSAEMDSYDDILARVEQACASKARFVVLCINSPGGLVSGCFESSLAIRSRCEAAGKRLISYVDGQACSAAYALACAASEIVVPPTGIVGHIGIIDSRVDVTVMDAAMGLKYAFITSGSRKADGNPHLAFTAAELKEKQVVVDQLAGAFFALVSDARGVSTKSIAALEARVFPGASAVNAGLADRVQSLDQLLAQLASTGEVMASKYEEARAALEEAAKGDGDEAARAKRALAAMDGDKDKEDDESAESEDDGAAAEGEEPDGDDASEEKDEKKEASALRASATVSAATAGDLAAVVSAQGRELAAVKSLLEGTERKALLASRPDLAPSLVKVLRGKPLAEVQSIVNAIPKPKAPQLAATATVAATRGESQRGAERAPAGGDPDLERADRVMGIAAYTSTGVTFKDNVLTLGAPVAKKGA